MPKRGTGKSKIPGVAEPGVLIVMFLRRIPVKTFGSLAARPVETGAPRWEPNDRKRVRSRRVGHSEQTLFVRNFRRKFQD